MRDLIRLAGALVAVVVIMIGYLDARRTHCRECLRAFGLWGDGRCLRCWLRRRRLVRSRR